MCIIRRVSERRGKPGRPPFPEARYRQVAQRLRTRLQQGDFDPPKLLPSLKQLALEHHVGRETARAAVEQLRHEGWIGLNARGRHVRAVQVQYARPNSGIVLIVYGVPLAEVRQHAGYNAMLLGMLDELAQRNCHVIVAHDFAFRSVLPDQYLSLPLTGILMGSLATRRLCLQMVRLPIPVLQVDVPPLVAGLPCVAVDNAGAAEDACSRLVEFGHRRIAMVRAISQILKQPDPDSKEREAGFLAALRKHRLRIRDCPVLSTFPRDRSHTGILRALSGPRRVTAALCVDPNRARLVARCAQHLGLKVPQDLSIAAFSGLEGPGIEFSGPKVDFNALGRMAASTLCSPKVETTRISTSWQDQPTLARFQQ